VRPFRAVVLILLSTLWLTAQENVPLPAKKEPPPAERPAPADRAPGLPKVKVAPSAPQFPSQPTPVTRVRLTPKPGVGESSVHGGQFRVYGPIKEHRDVLLSEAERTRREVAESLQFQSAFVFPIVIQIREAGALRPGREEIWTTVSQTDDGYRIEVSLVPQRNTVDGPLLRQEIVRAVLAEILLRTHGASELSGRDVPPPDWLLHGTLELLDYKALGRQSETFSTVFRLGHVLSIEDIFSVEPAGMDSVSRTVYRSSCCGLLLMLLERSQGGRNFAELCKLLPLMSGQDSSAIARAYPELSSSGNSLGKWWSLQLAAMSQPGLDELLSLQATDAELTKALTLRLAALPEEEKKPKKGLPKVFGKKKPEEKREPKPAPGTVQEFPFDQYARAMPRKDREAIFNRVALALTQISLRAHPLYRPVVGQYLSLVKELSAGKKQKEAATVIASLATVRRNLLSDMGKLEDYLDWYEATQLESLSGGFKDYLRAAAEKDRPPPPRRDPVSRYLNLMESEYSE